LFSFYIFIFLPFAIDEPVLMYFLVFHF